LIFSCEHGYRNYRSSTQCDRERTVSLGRDWIKFRISGDPDSEKTEWHNVMAVFELSDMFIIYRDADLMVILPKSSSRQKTFSRFALSLQITLARLSIPALRRSATCRIKPEKLRWSSVCRTG